MSKNPTPRLDALRAMREQNYERNQKAIAMAEKSDKKSDKSGKKSDKEKTA